MRRWLCGRPLFETRLSVHRRQHRRLHQRRHEARHVCQPPHQLLVEHHEAAVAADADEVAAAAEFPDPPADDSDSDWSDSDGEDAPPAAPDETLRRGAGGIGAAPEPELTAL